MSAKRSRAFRAYQKIKTLKPSRSLFDLSHERLMTCDMFKLYPVCAMEMSPGDTFHIANQSVTRLQPLNAPIMSSITQSTHYFFVPYRILDENWTEFITGGSEGENGGDKPMEPPEVAPILPRWIPTKNGIGTLWDYFGFPIGVDPKGAYPIDYLRRAYNLIWNEYFRDENLQDEVPLDNEDILYRDWKKDYFTSALLSQQRGVSPAMPVNISLDFNSSQVIEVPASNQWYKLEQTYSGAVNKIHVALDVELTGDALNSMNFVPPVWLRFNFINRNQNGYTDDNQDGNLLSVEKVKHVERVYLHLVYLISSTAVPNGVNSTEFQTPAFTINYTSTDSSGADGAGFDVKDLRQAFQIQKWLELANRGGVRYTEFLRAFFGVSPRDDRLQRPEYIGGSKSPIVISEVLQTSSTDNEPTPQGYMAGHGLGAERTYIGSYSAQEYGVLIGLMSYTTPPVYTQGINRMWLRRCKYDFLFPQFTHMSEQAIEGAEVFATGDETENRKVWGFNEVYDELRAMTSIIVGKMRTVFKYWHLARIFESKPALNADFVSGKDVSKRIFAVQNEDGIICHYANIIRAVRPLPKYGTPGGV